MSARVRNREINSNESWQTAASVSSSGTDPTILYFLVMVMAITIQVDPKLDDWWDAHAAPYQNWVAKLVHHIEKPGLYFPISGQTLRSTRITDRPGSPRDGGRLFVDSSQLVVH